MDKEFNKMQHKMKMWKMEENAYRKAYEKMLYDAILRDMEAEPDKYFKKENFSNIENYNSVKALIKERGRTWDYIRLCITLKKDFDNVRKVQWFLKKIEKMSTWRWIKEMTWNIEWRDHKEITGMHSHALIRMKEGKRYSQAKKQIIASWKEYGYTKMYPSNDGSTKYIKGVKKESKMDKVERDQQLRVKLKIDHWYENGSGEY